MTRDEGPLTITAAAELIHLGELTPSALLHQCLARIDRYEGRVQAWAYLDRERALQDAERLTAELKAGQYRGRLHGIPVGIKDIIDVFDMPTGCGSEQWANSFARKDATCVERLQQAGVVILGKTMTTAYASFDPPPTRNPWNLERTPGGSSSGSAAAVACGMCLGALATQTGGSITRPASYCGVCSLKPTYGRVSVDGVMPLAPSMDHVGVMANCVRDLAILLQPIARTDTKTLTKPIRYTGAIDPPTPQPPRQLAPLPEFPAQAGAEMTSAFRSLRERSISAGWGWYDLPLPPSIADAPRNHQAIMGVEAAAYHADRMRRRPEDYPPRISELIRQGLSISAPEYANVRKHLAQFRTEIDYAFINNWRAFITPATAGPAPSAETTGDPAFNSPWSYSGLPTLSLPFAWSKDDLPLAVQLVGEKGGEPHLFAVAAMLEETIGFEHRPLPL